MPAPSRSRRQSSSRTRRRPLARVRAHGGGAGRISWSPSTGVTAERRPGRSVPETACARIGAAGSFPMHISAPLGRRTGGGKRWDPLPSARGTLFWRNSGRIGPELSPLQGKSAQRRLGNLLRGPTPVPIVVVMRNRQELRVHGCRRTSDWLYERRSRPQFLRRQHGRGLDRAAAHVLRKWRRRSRPACVRVIRSRPSSRQSSGWVTGSMGGRGRLVWKDRSLSGAVGSDGVPARVAVACRRAFPRRAV